MSHPPVKLVVVLGGTRSGKSAVAERFTTDIAATRGETVTYVATGQATDADMSVRIAAHRARRPSGWATVEVGDGAALPGVLAGLPGVVLLDSLGTWVAGQHDFGVDVDGLQAALLHRAGATIVVSEEVGLSVHPATKLGRLFVDALGSVNQAVAAVADRAVLVVAGRIVELRTLEL